MNRLKKWIRYVPDRRRTPLSVRTDVARCTARLRGGHAHRLRLSVDIHDGIFDIPHRQA